MDTGGHEGENSLPTPQHHLGVKAETDIMFRIKGFASILIKGFQACYSLLNGFSAMSVLCYVNILLLVHCPMSVLYVIGQ